MSLQLHGQCLKPIAQHDAQEMYVDTFPTFHCYCNNHFTYSHDIMKVYLQLHLFLQEVSIKFHSL